MESRNLNIQNFRLLLCVGLMFPIGLAQAKIYKCEKSDGEVFYNDKPCPVGEKQTQIRNIQDPKNDSSHDRGINVGNIDTEKVSKEEKYIQQINALSALRSKQRAEYIRSGASSIEGDEAREEGLEAMADNFDPYQDQERL